MNNAHREILQVIYHKYDEWLHKEKFFCRKGCAACCTNNVMVSELEAENIIDHMVNEKKSQWFVQQLERNEGVGRVKRTTNGFARLCLGKEAAGDDEDANWNIGSCPFLHGDICEIYRVRPFSCRSFASRTDCAASGASTLPERIVTLNTVVMQLIEHLGQGQMWGNLIDILFALCDDAKNSDLLNQLRKKERVKEAKAKVLRAERIPGFLLMPGEENEVEGLLRTIYQEKIGQQSIADFLR